MIRCVNPNLSAPFSPIDEPEPWLARYPARGMVIDLVLGAISGAATGLAGSFVAAALQLAARRARNRALLAAGLPAYKDEIFRPLWMVLGPVGLVAGLAVVGAGRGLGAASAAGAALPLLVAATSLLILRQGR